MSALECCRGEDHLGPARGEVATAVGSAGLHDHGMALRAARHGERPARLDPFAGVVDIVDLRRIGKDAALLVDDQRIGLPALPQPEAGLHDLVGAVVAQIARRQLVTAEVARLKVADRRDDVPRHAAPAQHVERAQRAGDLVRVVEGRRHRGAEPDVLRDARHHRQHRQRIEEAHLPAALQDGVEVAPVIVEQAQRVGEEQAVELALLQHPRDMLVPGRVEEIVVGLGMPPHAVVMSGRPGLEERHQAHLARLAHRTLPRRFERVNPQLTRRSLPFQ
jgi:hypothetical protein